MNERQQTTAIVPIDARAALERPQRTWSEEARDQAREFLDNRDVRPTTKAVYALALDRFVTWFDKHGNKDRPTAKDIIGFREALKETGLKPNSTNLYLSAVKSFFSWSESMGGARNIARGVKRLKVESGTRIKYPQDAEARRLIENPDTTTLIGLRNRAILEVLARTGSRTIEITRANIDDLQEQDGHQLLFYQGKGRDAKDQKKVLPPQAVDAIDAYLKGRGLTRLSGPLFVSHSERNPNGRLTTRTIRRMVKKGFLDIGVSDPQLSAHSLRHFAATNALKHGASLMNVRDMLGHASTTTTEIYAKNLSRMDTPAEMAIRF
jgi:integrase/recombinase XerC